MNIVRIPRLLKNTTLLLTILGSSLLLSACGGDSKNNTSTSSSSSSSTSSHTFSSTPVHPALDGKWPNVNVSANHTKTLTFTWNSAPTTTTYYKLWKKANKTDSNSQYVQVGSDFTASTVSDTISVHLVDWVNSLYKVQACDASAACVDSTELIIDSAMLSAITYVKASNADASDWFGWSIAVSGDGNTMAVSAPAEGSAAKDVNGDQSDNNSPTSGAVYVFAKVNGNWVQEAYLKASNTEQKSDGITQSLPNARFGYQVALNSDGNTLAVSAINEDSVSIGINCDPHYETSSSSVSNSVGYFVYRTNYDIGAVYVFTRSNTQWTKKAYIKPLLPSRKLSFGTSLALSGDGKTLAVGTIYDNLAFAGIISNGSGNGSSNSSSSTGVACIDFSDNSSDSSSSSSVSSSSSSTDSSSSSSTPGGSNSGIVYIYKLKGDEWVEDALIKSSDASPGDNFGASIKLSYNGEILAIGAIGSEELVANSSSSASSTKETVTINMSGTDYQSELDSGAVYVYKRVADSWQESDKIKPVNRGWSQLFGYALGLSDDGKTLAVGTPGDWSKAKGTTGSPFDFTYEADLLYTTNGTYGYYYIQPKADVAQDKSSYASGAVYIYKYTDANGWGQDGYLKASNPQTTYQFGSSLSLSGSGDVLAVGCYLESSQAIGIGGDQADLSSSASGAAYIFKRDTTAWTQQNYVKAPNAHAEDRFARALSLDFTGDILAIGAYRESSASKGINGDQANKYDKISDAPSAASGAAYIY